MYKFFRIIIEWLQNELFIIVSDCVQLCVQVTQQEVLHLELLDRFFPEPVIANRLAIGSQVLHLQTHPGPANFSAKYPPSICSIGQNHAMRKYCCGFVETLLRFPVWKQHLWANFFRTIYVSSAQIHQTYSRYTTLQVKLADSMYVTVQ